MVKQYLYLALLFAVVIVGGKVLKIDMIVPAYEDRIVFLDIGQGDSALIQYNDFIVLVDGGPVDNLLYKLEKYLPGISPKIDVLVISHFHADHYSGFVEILDRYEVGEIWITNICDVEKLPQFLLGERALVKRIYAGDEFVFSDLRMDILGPINTQNCFSGVSQRDVNNSSIVLKVSTFEQTVLMTGDAEIESERDLINSYDIELHTDILKAGHHCSDTSSSKQFLNYVNPKLAICSAGLDNKYGHPSKSVIDSFRKLGVRYEITYEHGDIVVHL